MIPLVFILAAILIIAAVVLFVVDRRRRGTSATPVMPSSSRVLDDEPSDLAGEMLDVAAEDVVPEQSVSLDSNDSEPGSAPQSVSADTAGHEYVSDVDLMTDVSAEGADLVVGARSADSGRSANNDHVAENTPAAESAIPEVDEETLEYESQGNVSDAAQQVSKPSPIGRSTRSAQSAQPAQPAQSAQSDPPERGKSPRAVEPVRQRISGRRVRRLRKLWAQERNATYSRVDHELPSYWQRTPDGDAKAVVSGFAFGREMHIADVGGITTIAIRRSVASDEVFELRRSGSTTLPHVATEAGLIVAATNPELIHRIFDDRASRMLIDVHPVITRMWSENSWSLAQLIDNSVPEDWEGALESLSAFSDIARRLPPAEGEIIAPDTSQWDPTRLQLTECSSDSSSLVSDGNGRGHLHAVPNRRRNGGVSSDSQDGDSHDSYDPDAEGTSGEEPLEVEEILYVDPSSSSAAAGTATEDSQWSSQSEEHPTVAPAIDGSSWRPARDTSLDSTTLPSRSMARKMGTSVGDSEDIGDSNQQIPALGEDPEHSYMRSSQGRVVRSDVKPASIFADVTPDAQEGDQTTARASGYKESAPDSSDE